MRNGAGDQWFALLCSSGVALNGLAHEAPIFRPGAPWPGIFEKLPVELWSCGPVELPSVHDPDGSEALLSILAGQFQHYVEFACDYYEVEIDPVDVAAVYRHDPLTSALVRRLNPRVDLDSLEADMKEIGYPEPGDTPR